MNPLVVTLVIILLPGIFATVICDKITRHSEWNWFKYVLYSVLLGWLSYVAFQVWSFILSIDIAYQNDTLSFSFTPEPLKIWNALLNGEGSSGSSIPYSEILGSLACSILVALLASATINYKVINKIARILKISTKYGDENLFSYYLNLDEVNWVYVRDKEDNLTYKGQIVMHSESSGIQELVLSDVDVYQYSDSEYLYSTPSIYFCKNVGKFKIEAAITTNEGNSDD